MKESGRSFIHCLHEPLTRERVKEGGGGRSQASGSGSARASGRCRSFFICYLQDPLTIWW